MLGQEYRVLTTLTQVLKKRQHAFQVSFIRRNKSCKSGEASGKITHRNDAVSNKSRKVDTIIENNPILETINKCNIISNNAVVNVTPPAICILSAILSASKSNEILSRVLKSSTYETLTKRVIHTSTRYQHSVVDPKTDTKINEKECVRSIINGIPNEESVKINKIDMNSSIQKLISELEDFIQCVKETSAKNKPTPYINSLSSTEKTQLRINENVKESNSKKDTKQQFCKERKPLNITIKDLCRINSPHGSKRDLMAASALLHSQENKTDNINKKTKTLDDLISEDQSSSIKNPFCTSVTYNRANKDFAVNINEVFKEWETSNRNISHQDSYHFKELVNMVKANDKLNKTDDIKTSKVQNNIYKFPMMLGNEIPSTTALAKATFVSGQSKRETPQKWNSKTAETNNIVNVLAKEVQPQTSPKETSTLSQDKITTMLREHKILLETLLDKVNNRGNTRKLQPKELNKNKDQMKNTKFEEMKYEVFKQIWNRYLDCQEKNQEKVQRVTSKTGVNVNFSSNKDSTQESHNLSELVKYFEGGLSLNRDSKPVGNQLGDIKEIIDTERTERYKNKSSLMTSPNKNKNLTKTEKSSFKSKISSLNSLEDILRAPNLDVPKLATQKRRNTDATPIKRLQNKLKTSNLSFTNIPETKITKRGSIRSMSSSSITLKKAFQEKEKPSGVFLHSKKINNCKRGNNSIFQVKINAQESNSNRDSASPIRECSTAFYGQGRNHGTALIAAKDENSDMLIKSTGSKTKTKSVKRIFDKNAVRGYHKALNTKTSTRSKSSEYQLSKKESKFITKKKSMDDLKNKIMQRNEFIRKEASKFKLDRDKLYKSQENYTISGHSPYKTEYNALVKNTWRPTYPKSDRKPKSDTESFVPPAAKMTTPSISAPTPPTPDYQILQASAVPVSPYMFKSDSKPSSRLSTNSLVNNTQNKINEEYKYDEKITQEQKFEPVKRNWTTISPISYVDIVSEFRDRKPTPLSKQKQLVPISSPPENLKTKEIKRTEEALKFTPPVKSNAPKRNWTTISPVTFVDNVLEFRFKKQDLAKQHQVEMSSNATSKPSTQKPPEAPAPRMYQVPTESSVMTDPVEPKPCPIESKPAESPIFKDDTSKQLWNEPFKTY